MGCCGSKEKPDPNPAQTAEVIEKMTVLLECPCVEKATKKGLKMVLSDLEKDDLEDFNVKQKQSIVQNKEMPPQIKQMMLKLVMFKMDYKKIIAAQAEEWREDGYSSDEIHEQILGKPPVAKNNEALIKAVIDIE